MANHHSSLDPDDYSRVRSRTLAFTAPLEIEDFGVQPMADASPPKWHLAHTTWFFATFVLEPFLAGYRMPHPAYRVLFNSYYDGVGPQFPRERRGQLSRPTLDEVLEWRAAVDSDMQKLLAEPGPDRAQVIHRTRIGLNHEEQHQELLVTDLKYAFGRNPLLPSYGAADLVPPGLETAMTFSRFPSGLVEIGTDSSAPVDVPDRFAFDNETPAHRVWLEAFELADRCMTCGEFLAFMEDDGYGRPELWLADGRTWLARFSAPHAPLYWMRQGSEWNEYTLSGTRSLDPNAPVTHLNYYEADAIARWAGARLPTEAEWEVAARQFEGSGGCFLESATFHPRPDGCPEGTTGPRDLFGNQWEWTASAHLPYPGYTNPAGALGEYNGKFMCNQMVLRGGSCASPEAHVRATYRNFFYPTATWQFTGVRLARTI